ncbi:MAG: hypothetical protein WCP20_13270 [Desulfuromonadales bacterium]
MKCPKCGYNSFEYNSSCKKCSSDLGGYKQTYNITPIVLPHEAKELKASEFRMEVSSNERPVENVETHDDMFSFDLPEDAAPSSPPSSASPQEDPFNFDYDLPAVSLQKAPVEDGKFADLLETTSQVDDSPFSSFAATPSTPSAPPAKAAPTTSPGEFDLENFSWDDTPVATATGGGQVDSDDFDSLFGDIGDSTKK